MATTISLINLKGGVGKTSTTVALAEFLASEHGQKVLIIDLDPQTNATVALIGEKEWEKKRVKKETLYQLFKDKIDKTKLFDINKAIARGVSNVKYVRSIDLLPSSIELVDIQDTLPLISSGQFHSSSPTTILKDALGSVLDNYDIVLIDCPPNLGIITLNGIRISDYYLIPTVPDILSTYGIPQIVNRIEEFAEVAGVGIKPMGIIISMIRGASNLHYTTVNLLKKKAKAGDYPRILNTQIPLTVKAAEAADYGEGERKTIKQKYGYGDKYETYFDLSKEVLNYVQNPS